MRPLINKVPPQVRKTQNVILRFRRKPYVNHIGFSFASCVLQKPCHVSAAKNTLVFVLRITIQAKNLPVSDTAEIFSAINYCGSRQGSAIYSGVNEKKAESKIFRLAGARNRRPLCATRPCRRAFPEHGQNRNPMTIRDIRRKRPLRLR